MRATKFWLVLALHLIGWDGEGGASILDQSQSEVKKYQTIQDHFYYSIKNCSYKF